MKELNMTCISCPMGCMMKLKVDNEKNLLSIEGNNCKRGELYAKDEVKNPKRMVCSTVRVIGGIMPIVSVKTEMPIPKDKIFNIMEEINRVQIKAPVEIGYIVLKNVCNTNVNIIATSNVIIK
ncbi:MULTISPECIES: DUF1667 domain-containing protein [Peptoniphilus]|uniref:DUF1667 domain-containing protein n=1 Tax=Peptoniphilus TaxID=162289 RepID=UPI0001DA9999|nr:MULTISPECIES: DUF1667 domain-containing protein [Peptoniphilus]EFI41435.1 hypothetical protein HMPREF0629_00054 [Peptoniphilus sp. oral taxon 386 str. F0131]